jgi:hypothetical protein
MIDFASVRDVFSEAWNLSLDMLAALIMPDFDITLEDDDDL